MASGLGPAAAAAAAALVEEEHQLFRSDEWLAANRLTRETVMDYFALSPFFDRTSTNAQAAMSGVLGAQSLRGLVGIEYEVVHAEGDEPQSTLPSLFIIERRFRQSPTEFQVQAVYYVVNSVVYRAPDLYKIKAAHHLQSALEKLRGALVFRLDSGYSLEAPDVALSSAAPASSAAEATAPADTSAAALRNKRAYPFVAVAEHGKPQKINQASIMSLNSAFKEAEDALAAANLAALSAAPEGGPPRPQRP